MSNEFENLRMNIRTMSLKDLKCVSSMLVDGIEKADILSVKNILRLYKNNRLPSQRLSKKHELSIAEEIISNYEAQSLYALSNDIIEIAYNSERSSTELMMALSLRYPLANLTPPEGIHKSNQSMMLKILTLAGFTPEHIYNRELQRTRRVWCKNSLVVMLSLHQVQDNFNENIQTALKLKEENSEESFIGLI